MAVAGAGQFGPGGLGYHESVARFGDLSDTDPRAAEVWLTLHREMPMREKADMALRMFAMSMSLAEAGVRLNYPDASPREIRLRAAARLYGNPQARKSVVGSR